MAQLGGYGVSSNLITAEQRSRERERRRYGNEKIEGIPPSFPEPRKITERQDSLTNKIQNVLGDMGAVQKVIERSPNVWYGTSRNASTSKSYSVDRSNTPQQEGSSSSKPLVSSSSLMHSNSTSRSAGSSSKSSSLHVQKLSEGSSSRSSNSALSSGYSGIFSNKSTVNSREGQRKPMTNRARLQSRDMPATMEDIFREMQMNEEEPLTAIHAPQIAQESGKNELKTKSSADSSNHGDEGNSHKNSDSDSSDEDDDSDSDCDDNDGSGWDLLRIVSDLQKTDAVKSLQKQEESASQTNTTRPPAVENTLYKPALTRDENISAATPKDEKKPEKQRGRPPGSRSAASKVSSSQPPPSHHRRTKPHNNPAPSSQPVPSTRDVTANKAAEVASSPEFSVRNDAFSPPSSASNERLRTAMKSPKTSFTVYSSSSSSNENESSDEDYSSPSQPSFPPINQPDCGLTQASKQGASILVNQSKDDASGYEKADRHPRHRTSRQDKVLRFLDNSSRGSNSKNAAQPTVYQSSYLEKNAKSKPASRPQPEKQGKKYPSLWAQLPDFPLIPALPLCNPSPERGKWPRNERQLENSRCDSTGFTIPSDTFPDRQHPLVEDVQVSTDVTSSSTSPHRHKRPFTKHPPYHKKSKRRKMETSPTRVNVHNNSNQSIRRATQPKKESSTWKGVKEETSDPWNERTTSNQQTLLPTEQAKSAASNPNAASLQEPDSSWPEQETRFKTSEQFMREGKRLKHEGDSYTDTKTGRTRNGESLSRALLYFEASLCFLMNGYMLEVENSGERGDSSQPSHSPTSMYNQTINLLDYVRKMRPHDSGEETHFKRLNISCLRTQALLFLRVYRLKKEVAGKYHETIAEYLKSNKLSHVPSPWHSTASQNAVSPVSPAVPSPYGAPLPGPSPLASSNACEQVSSSTQVSKMTSPAGQNGMLLPAKTHEILKQYHNITASLMQAHDKWDQAEGLMAEHTDFFRHVDVLRGHTLNLDNSVKDLATYNKVILRQLRGAYKSPKD